MRRALGISLAGVLGLAVAGVGAGPAVAAGCSPSAPLQNAPGCNLNHVTLSAHLALADSGLRGANLNRAQVTGQGALLGSNLSGANLNHASITAQDALIDADLQGANLEHATLDAAAIAVGADLTGVNLNNTDVAGLGDLLSANLTGANLHGATLSGTWVLTGANLTGAHLDDATISGSNALFEANLTGADLRGAQVTGGTALTGAVYSHTTCPDGTNSDSDDGTCSNNLTTAVAPTGSPGPPHPPGPPTPGSSAQNPAGLAVDPHATICGSCGGGNGLVVQGPLSAVVAGSPFSVIVDEESSGVTVTTDNTTSVTLSLTPPSGGLSCTNANNVGTLSATLTSGLAKFTCSIADTGQGDILTATPTNNSALSAATSMSFNVDSGAAQLAFLPLQHAPVAGDQFSVSVQVRDASGNYLSNDDSTSVTLSLGANPSTASLDCNPDTVTDSGGVAQFTCVISAGGDGFTLSATGTSGGTALGPVSSQPFDVAQTPPPGTILSSAGLYLDAYCASVGWAASHVPGIGRAAADGGTNIESGPGQAFDWYCVNAAGNAGAPISIQAACDHQYPGTVAYLADPNDAYTWSCVTLQGATSTSTFTVTNGGYYGTLPDGTTLLADGGFGGGGGLPDFVYQGTDGTLLADGGLGGGGSLPDFVYDSTGTPGGSVTYSTPLGGFEVAESGSLATGGAI